MKTELFEAVYNLSNDTYVPISHRTMGATTAKIDRWIIIHERELQELRAKVPFPER